MKNALMMLLFLVGFAATEANAQKCCSPCTPACCAVTCTPEQQKNCAIELTKSSTAEQQKACTPAEMKACGKMTAASTKSNKACCAAPKKTEAVDAKSSIAPAETKPTEATAVLVKND